MDELILKHLRGETSDIEARQVERWRSASPANERTFRETKAVWTAAEPPGGAVGPAPEVEALVAEAERRRRQGRARAGRRAVLRSPWTGYGLAAAAVAGLVLVVSRGAETPEPGTLSPLESTSVAGEEVTMALSDGSVLRLAPATTVEFPPDPLRRQVVLDGRAFFAVSEGERPFVVRTRVGEVTVHGTRFEVRTTGGELRVVVVEGGVRVTGSAGEVQVLPGQVAFLGSDGTPRTVEREDVWSLLQWTGGLLVFQETPLSRVAEEVGRHFGRPVVVDDPALAGRRVTAWFGDEPLEEVVASVCLVVGATRCEVGAEGVSLAR
ncbi:MAG: FecR domain-containing protein [Longimicrobiales bacterium]